MNTKHFIGKNLDVTIDRKLGSKHPKWNFFLPYKLWIYS